MKRIVIMGGGTFSHVRSHNAQSTPAFGKTARYLEALFNQRVNGSLEFHDYQVDLILTKMADYNSNLVTNEDVEAKLEELIKDSTVKVIIFNVALADHSGQIDDVPSGKYAERLETSDGVKTMILTPTKKLIGMIRKERKDIFVVGFKTTANKSEDEMYAKGLKLLKQNSLNLVMANDVVNHKNFLITPEEARYARGAERINVLEALVDITMARMTNTFTRSTVVPGKPVAWSDSAIPQSLRDVVDYCIANGAYKPVLGKTVGHFAVKVSDTEIFTTIRKTNFNNLNEVGLVKIVSTGKNSVVAHGSKPSVGGQSQRIIFNEHSDLDCIVHFHCPPKVDTINTRPQWQNECGSHQCGQNTSDGLGRVDLGDGDYLYAVYLEEHGPNIVFNRNTPSEKVKAYIEKTFDLKQKTGGLVTV